jgi:hypothetical protein
MKDVDNTYMPKVTEPADREASRVAVQQVSKSKDLPYVLGIASLLIAAILWQLGVLPW